MGDLGVGFKLFGTIIMAEERQVKAVAEEEQECNSMITKEGGAPEEEEATMGPAAALACPRCKSRDTKFCYFNNYNVNQPRHFCRGCHRYWTAGGTLRNVPIGTVRRRRRPAARSGSTATPCIIEYSSPCFDAGVAMEKWVLPRGRTGGGFPGRLR